MGQIIGIKKEKGSTTDATEIVNILIVYYQQIYVNKFKKLDEVDEFLKRKIY